MNKIASLVKLTWKTTQTYSFPRKNCENLQKWKKTKFCTFPDRRVFFRNLKPKKIYFCQPWRRHAVWKEGFYWWLGPMCLTTNTNVQIQYDKNSQSSRTVETNPCQPYDNKIIYIAPYIATSEVARAQVSSLFTILILWKCLQCFVPSVLWRCWLGSRKGIRPVKNWVVGCWRGYLSAVRCRLAHGPAEATATHCLLFR